MKITRLQLLEARRMAEGAIAAASDLRHGQKMTIARRELLINDFASRFTPEFCQLLVLHYLVTTKKTIGRKGGFDMPTLIAQSEKLCDVLIPLLEQPDFPDDTKRRIRDWIDSLPEIVD